MAKTNIYLYGGLCENASDCFAAKKYMDSLGIQYNHLFYSDPGQAEQVLSPVNSWFEGKSNITTFPFVIWDEPSGRKYAAGLEAILEVAFIDKPATPPAPTPKAPRTTNKK